MLGRSLAGCCAADGPAPDTDRGTSAGIERFRPPAGMRSRVWILTLLLIGTAVGGLETPGRWISRGPDGWALGTLTIDPSNSLVLYATAPRGLYRSLDGGESWRSLYLTNDPPGAGLSGFTIEMRDPKHLILASDEGFVQSRDGGATWILTAPPAPPPIRPGPMRFYLVEFDAFDSEAFYAAAQVRN